MNESDRRCALCGRKVPRLERHHLIPKTRHSNKANKKRFDREQVHERIALLCRPCHKTVHATLTEKELEREYNTVEALAAHPDIRRFVRFVRRQPPGAYIRVRSTKDKRHRIADRDRRGRR